MIIYQAILPRDAGMVKEGRRELASLLEKLRVPSKDDLEFAQADFEVHIILGELLSNVAKYGVGKSAGLRLAVDPGRVVMKIDYLTEVFDTTPRKVPLLAKSGRGLEIIHNFAAEGGGRVRWLFRERETASDIKDLRVIVVKKWQIPGA